MKFIRVLIILLLNIFSIVQLQSQKNQSGVVVDEIIGRIDDYIVLRSELESTYLEILSRGERISVCCFKRFGY